MSLVQYCFQATQQGLIIIASVVEVINCVCQKSHNYKPTLNAACMLDFSTVLSIVQMATLEVQPSTTVNRLHARSAMYLSDQPSWWSRPVTHVRLDGHVSTTDIWWRSIRGKWGSRRTVITAAATYVLTRLLRLQLGRLAAIKRFFISSESVVELCRVPNLPKVRLYCVWCAPNNGRWLQPLMNHTNDGIHLLCTNTLVLFYSCQLLLNVYDAKNCEVPYSSDICKNTQELIIG